MEKRFTVKDFFLFVLLIALIFTVYLAMVQFDRQFTMIKAIRNQNGEMARDLVGIQKQLAQGVVVGRDGPGGARTSAVAAEKMQIFKPLAEAQAKPDFARGDWLVDNFGTKVGRLTPLVSSDLYQRIVESRVMETLATRDPQTMKFVPLLAESWENKDNTKQWEQYVAPLLSKKLPAEQFTETLKKDPKAPVANEIVFKLRTGITFSDGAAMTADDVVFTFEWILNPAVNAPRDRAYLDKLKYVKANGPYEVAFGFSEPFFGSFETVGGTSIMSKAFYGKFTPDQFNERTGLLIGTGPYKLEDPENWAPGKPMELVRNDRYWGVAPTFDRLVFREVEDESAEMVMLGNGEIDILPCLPEQYEKLLKDERILKMTQHYKYPSPLNGYSYIGWNQERTDDGTTKPTAFADKRVRRAMTMLIDRDRIAKETFMGYATVASGPFDPNGPQSAPDVKPLPYDEPRAKALLAECGFADKNGDGVIEGPDGRPFKFKLSYPSGSATIQRVVFFLKDSFSRAGIIMDPDPLDWPVLLDRIKRGQFDACTLAWGGTVESDPYQVFHSSQIKDQGDNRTHYVNAKLDEVIEQARRTLDDDKRMKLWHEVHRILHEDQPYTFLMNRPSLVFINGRVKNVEVTKLGLNYLRLYPNPSPWYVPRAQQRYTR